MPKLQSFSKRWEVNQNHSCGPWGCNRCQHLTKCLTPIVLYTKPVTKADTQCDRVATVELNWQLIDIIYNHLSADFGTEFQSEVLSFCWRYQNFLWLTLHWFDLLNNNKFKLWSSNWSNSDISNRSFKLRVVSNEKTSSIFSSISIQYRFVTDNQ